MEQKIKENQQKNLIKKNLKQFCAWINETEEVLVGYPSIDNGIFEWKKVESINDFNILDSKYVINDDAVELRKGIAEGKQLLFFQNNNWIPIEDSYIYTKNVNGYFPVIDENYSFDNLYLFIGLYKIEEKNNK